MAHSKRSSSINILSVGAHNVIKKRGGLPHTTLPKGISSIISPPFANTIVVVPGVITPLPLAAADFSWVER